MQVTVCEGSLTVGHKTISNDCNRLQKLASTFYKEGVLIILCLFLATSLAKQQTAYIMPSYFTNLYIHTLKSLNHSA